MSTIWRDIALNIVNVLSNIFRVLIHLDAYSVRAFARGFNNNDDLMTILVVLNCRSDVQL